MSDEFLNCDDDISIRISAITVINWYIWHQNQQCVEVKGRFKTLYLYLNSTSDFSAIEKLANIVKKDLSQILEIYNK